ncbi:MAG: histidine kinase [Fibrobacter sp.]|nr:histidine kinase [Fibrobacter sp.]
MSWRFILPACIVWIIAGTFSALVYSLSSNAPLLSTLLLILPTLPACIILSITGRFVCRFFPANWSNIYRVISVQFLYMLLSTALWFTLWYIYASILRILFPLVFSTGLFSGALPFVMPSVALVMIIFILVHYIILFVEQNRIASEELLHNKLQLAEAELKALKNTIHPHFLFNSLSMLQSLITLSPAKASAALSYLSEFLLYSVQFSRKTTVTIAEEITHAKNYTAVELLRRSDSFSVDWDIDTRCNDYQCIPFILQPLIENAIKHGIESSDQKGYITVTATLSDNNIAITVTNSVHSTIVQNRKSGTGIETLTKRLYTSYGASGKILTQKNDTRFIATITIPLQKENT